MGLFDKLKQATESVARDVVQNVGCKSEDVQFTKLPDTLDDFKALPQASLASPFSTAAMTVLALCFYPKDKELSLAMLGYLRRIRQATRASPINAPDGVTVGYDAFYGTKITDDRLIADTVSFDEETGVLTLLPCHINKEDVRAYADNAKVTSIVAAEGAILPEDSSYLFAGLDPSSLTAVAFKTNFVSIDLSNADTSNVTDMQRIFSSLKALTSLDISGFDTSEVTDMSDIFLESNALTSLDLSSFDTSKVNNTSWMFNSCQKLKTIYVSDKWSTAAITMSGSMFSGCKALVGGNGTVYDSTNVDATYARIENHAC